MNTLPAKPKTVVVWDPLIRIFHWSLAAFFFIAYLSEDDLPALHVYAGYAVAGLLVFRLVWGIIGTRHARFTDFVTRPSEAIRYIGNLVSGRPGHYLGHNPAGGAMIVALLLTLAITAFTGMALIAGEGSGPLAGTFVVAWSGDWLEETHDVFANLALFLVFFHVAGVLVGSLAHRENLIKAMFTGRKPVSPADDGVEHGIPAAHLKKGAS